MMLILPPDAHGLDAGCSRTGEGTGWQGHCHGGMWCPAHPVCEAGWSMLWLRECQVWAGAWLITQVGPHWETTDAVMVAGEMVAGRAMHRGKGLVLRVWC